MNKQFFVTIRRRNNNIFTSFIHSLSLTEDQHIIPSEKMRVRLNKLIYSREDSINVCVFLMFLFLSFLFFLFSLNPQSIRC